MEELQQLINQKQGEILGFKSILIATDWEVIKATELKKDLNPEIKNARADARECINRIESEIEQLQKSLFDESILVIEQ